MTTKAASAITIRRTQFAADRAEKWFHLEGA
jgi:hypothetical protein